MNTFPRVEVPGVDGASRALVQALAARQAEVDATAQRTRKGMVAAMRRLGRTPYLGHVWREPKPTKHVRAMRRRAAAAAIVAGRTGVSA